MPSDVSDHHKPGAVLVSVSASWVAVLHTIGGLGAFLSALAVGCWLHYHNIVKNQYYGYPQEWFPSVSATIGDWAPERPLFQNLIAYTSGPRLFLILLSYLLARSSSTSALPLVVAVCGVVRTLMCGGWVYVTSTDGADFHDFAMISYLVLTVPWQIGNLLGPSSRNVRGHRRRRTFSCLFFGCIPPLIYLYIQHKVHRVAGAYTRYAFFEWSLIIYDVLYDSTFLVDFARLELRVVDLGTETALKAGAVEAERALPPRQPNEEDVEVPALDSWSAREVMAFAADSYMGFIFWSTLTALGPVIFYFSVWSMGLNGQEVLLFATLAPVLLAVPPLRRLFTFLSPVLHALSLAGVASYLVDRNLFYSDAIARLRAVALSVGLSTLAYVADWSAAASSPRSAHVLDRAALTFCVGWLLSVVAKFANQSLNPVWPILRANNGGWNKTGLALAVLASAERLLRRSRRPVGGASSDALSRSIGILASVRAGAAVGGLFFLVHTLFTDAGTTIAWTWSGYPIRGPMPVPHGALTVLALCMGLFLAAEPSAQALIASPAWGFTACNAAAVLYRYPGWRGYGGGWMLGVVAASLFPGYIAQAAKGKSALSFGVGFLLYDLLELAHTFTVAYAFVPGGQRFRERTDAVLAVTMALVMLGVLFKPSKVRSTSLASGPSSLRMQRMVNFTLGALAVLAVGVGVRRIPKQAPVPYNAPMKAFRAGIWTVHFGVDSGMWESQRRMRDLFRELELDIVGLLESDLQRIVLGNRDLTQFVSEDLGMYVDLGPGPNKHTWGAALLSKFPILNSTHHLLPSPRGELAPAIHATLDVFGTMVDVVVSHNGQEEDPYDRYLQSRELGRIMAEAYPRPTIFLGYVVTKPHADKPAPYKYLVEDGKMLDIEPADSDRWCEYVLFRGLRRTAYARINRGSKPAITDTELQLGAFQIPDEPVDPDKDPSEYWTKGEEHVDPALRLPAWLKGEGRGGHHFISLQDQFVGIEGPVYYV